MRLPNLLAVIAALILAAPGYALDATIGLGPVPVTSAAPSGAASGDLTGSYPSPTIAATAWASPGAIGSTTATTGKFTTLTVSGLTSSRVPFAGTGGALNDSGNFTFDGTNTLTLGGHGCVGIVTTSALFTESTFSANGNAGLLVATVGDSYLNGATGRSVFLRINAVPVITVVGSAVSVDADLNVTTVGKGLKVKEGANARMGTATLVAGSSVVANTSVTASTRAFLTSNADGGTPGWLRVSARSAGTSFTITSSSGTDTSTVAWILVEPSP